SPKDSLAFQGLVDKLFGDMQTVDGLQYKSLGKGKVYLGTYHADSFAKLGIDEDVIINDKNNPSISWNHRTFKDGDSYFVANQDSSRQQTHLSFRTMAAYVYVYDVVQDEIMPIASEQKDNRTELTVSFEPFQSFFVLFSEHQIDITNWEVTETETLQGNWKLQLNEVEHEPIIQQQPDFWTVSEIDDVRYHSGSGSYTLTFNQPRELDNRRVKLKLD